MKVVVIEDKQPVVRDVSFCLEVRYPDVSVVSTASGHKGLELIETESPDLVLADCSLPDIESLEFIHKIRAFSNVPLILLYDSGTDMDRAKGLEAGADEYVTNPFSPIELLAKVKALLRRTQELGFRPDSVISINHNFTVNFTTHEVFLNGNQVKLTPIEYRLFSFMVRNEGKMLAHEVIMEKVWGENYSGDSTFVKKYIYRLRSKFESSPQTPRMFITERGVGYRFVRPA